MRKDTLFKIGATSLITLGALGLALTSDKKDAYVDLKLEDSIAYNSGYAIRNVHNEIVNQVSDNAEFQNVVDDYNKKVEEERQRKLEEQRLLEEQRKKEELARKLAEEEAKNNLGQFNVSWYTATCKGCSGVTAKGVNVKNTTKYQGFSIAATDWNVIPPYSIIEVEGYGQFIVIDRGGAIKGKKLDLLVATKDEAYKNGRQQLNVKVVRWGDGK